MIKPFEKILDERQWRKNKIDSILKNIEIRLRRRLPEGTELGLTEFQQQAIEDPQFWRDWNASDTSHLMVQAATSAGKTLVSELNILDTLQHDKKAIVLVPLKAMVRERMLQFREDMKAGSYQVYGASSDYMEYDEQLLDGSYDVAIIVYEKFYAMLGQGPSRLMDGCDLLVVDELSMLSQEQRGPKLEIALETVREKWPDTRIMALATCDCRTQSICSWLGIKNPIYSSKRPVALEEHLVLPDGRDRSRTIPQNYQYDEIAPRETPDYVQIPVPGFSPELEHWDKRKKLLLAVLDQVHNTRPQARTLVFVNSQSAAVHIAKFLLENAGDLCPDVTGCSRYNNFHKMVEACDPDEDRDLMINSLLPHGIAYHHAGISTNLRELLEEEFLRSDSVLKVIVATETLTVGVNMPFDVMIMMTSEVYRGKENNVPLTKQEYRNYIGRAGRLGLNNGIGQSYLFVEKERELEKYWSSIYDQSEVLSALINSDETRLAPYYLSLLVSRAQPNQIIVPERDLKPLYEKSLSACCKSTRKAIDYSDLARKLYDAFLTNEQKMDFGRSRSSGYAVSDFGANMAPYALSLRTCCLIYQYFYEGYLHGGLPLGTTKEDIDSDRYLLDILYHICRHEEVMFSSNPSYPVRPNEKVLTAKGKVVECLKKLCEEKTQDGRPVNELMYQAQPGLTGDELKELQEDSDIWCLLNRSNLSDEHGKLKAAMRAILLYYWVKGRQVKEILKETGFDKFSKIISGDLERLAEVVSFHLDAVYRCTKTVYSGVTPLFDEGGYRAFRGLLSRVKYGMPRALVPLANKHVHGLDRRRLIDLYRQAEKHQLSPIEFLFTAPKTVLLKYLTPTQLVQLRKAMTRGQPGGDAETELKMLCSIIARDIGSADPIEELVRWDGGDSNSFFQTLVKITKDLPDMLISTEGSSDLINWCWKELTPRAHMAVLSQANAKDSNTVQRFQEFLESNSSSARLLIVHYPAEPEAMQKLYQKSQAHAVMDHVYFAYLLANCMRLGSNPHSLEALFQMLSDMRGVFSARSRVNELEHYLRRDPDSTRAVRYRLLPGSFSTGFDQDQLENSLNSDPELKDYELLPWGSGLYDSHYDYGHTPTVILLNRKTVTSRDSLNRFLTLMRKDNFENCLLLTSQEDYNTWTAQTIPGEPINWQAQYSRIPYVPVNTAQEARNAIRNFLAKWVSRPWLVGISYAHYEEEPTDPDRLSDNQKLNALADTLAERYGCCRIAYDRFEPFKTLFYGNNAGTESLKVYRQCRVFLLLWNFWAKENAICQKERQVIQELCQAGEATCIILQQGRDNDPSVKEEDWMKDFFTYPVDDPDLPDKIQTFLKQHGAQLLPEDT